jgi:hypothetical protein
MRFSIVFVTENETRKSFAELYRTDPTSANNVMEKVNDVIHKISKYPGDDIASRGGEWEYPGTVELDNFVYTIHNPNITREFLRGYFMDIDPIEEYTLDFIDLTGGKRKSKVFAKGRRSRLRRTSKFNIRKWTRRV